MVDEDPANHEASASDVVCGGEDWSWDSLLEGHEDEEVPHASTIMV